MTQDTRFVHLTAASKQLFSRQCARTDCNMCVLSLPATVLLPREWVRPQQAATFMLPQQKSCQCARSRIKARRALTVKLPGWRTLLYTRARALATSVAQVARMENTALYKSARTGNFSCSSCPDGEHCFIQERAHWQLQLLNC